MFKKDISRAPFLYAGMVSKKKGQLARYAAIFCAFRSAAHAISDREAGTSSNKEIKKIGIDDLQAACDLLDYGSQFHRLKPEAGGTLFYHCERNANKV
jgi:hypothetical protein